jgi:23S rRNA G2445 N2-methylase RlmL
MIERLALGPAARVVGYDIDPAALDCARANLAAANLTDRVRLEQRDARDLPWPSGSVRTILTDLPYAMLHGSSEANAELYPALLREAARVLEPGGRCIVVSTQRRLMDHIISGWSVRETVRFSVSHARGTINPTIYVLTTS